MSAAAAAQRRRVVSLADESIPAQPSAVLSSSSLSALSISSSSSLLSPLLPSFVAPLLASPSSSLSPPSSSSASELEALFLSFAAAYPAGIRSEQFTVQYPHVPITALLPIINGLLSRGRLSLLSDSSTSPPTPHYRVVSSSDATRLSLLSPSELVIYHMIAKEGNRGLWIRDIRRRSALSAVEVGKALKSLLGRRLVKAERSVEGKNKRVYMLFELEPAKEVRGNSWYGGGEFDADFIAALREMSVKCVRERRPAAASAQQVSDYLRQSGVFEVECSLDEVEMVLDSLVYDGFLADDGAGKGRRQYRLQRGGVYECEVVAVPCIVCPVRSQCSEESGSTISPYTCEYYTQWLEF